MANMKIEMSEEDRQKIKEVLGIDWTVYSVKDGKTRLIKSSPYDSYYYCVPSTDANEIISLFKKDGFKDFYTGSHTWQCD